MGAGPDHRGRSPGNRRRRRRRPSCAAADVSSSVAAELRLSHTIITTEQCQYQCHCRRCRSAMQHPDAATAAAGGITEDAGASPAGQRDRLQRGPRRGEGAGDMQDSAGDR